MKIRNLLALSALAGVGGYCYYTYGLSDERRAELEERIERTRETLTRVYEQIKPLAEDAVHAATPEQDHSNKEHTRQQWESLGF